MSNWQSKGPAVEPRELLASTGFLIARLGAESRGRFSRLMAQNDLSAHHFGLLMALGANELVPQQQIGGMIGVDPRNVVPIIDELETRGLVSRQVDPRDRRRCNVQMSPTGRRFMAKLRMQGKKIEDEMFNSLSASERSTLHQLLLKLYETIDKEE